MKINFNYLVLASLVAATCPFVARAQTKAPIVAGQSGTLQEFLSGDLVPLDLKFSQMKTGWSRVHIERKGAVSEKSTAQPTRASDPVEQGFRQYFGQDAEFVFTQGRTVNLNGAEQLVIYRSQFPTRAESERWFEGRLTDEMKAVEMNPEKYMALVLPLVREFLDTVPLRASLISVDTIGSLEDVQSFENGRAFAAFESDIRQGYKADSQKRQGAEVTSSEANLNLLAQGLEQYALDYDDTLPPLDNWSIADKVLQPYINSEIKLTQPGQQIYTNPLLSKKKMAHLAPYKNSLVVFYTSPDEQNNRWVVMLDGEVKLVNQNEWPQIKKASRLP